MMFDEVKYRQADNLPKGWIWEMYDDGSGHLKSPSGESYMSYDFQTKEYKETENSWWSSMVDGSETEPITFKKFFNEAEKIIKERYLNKDDVLKL